MKPLVSILIPAYNAAEYIAATLESAVAQTWPHREIIVVNDGSRDRTLEIARSFEPRGVTVVTQSNQGAAAARNAALKASRGDYIQWLDADDLLAPEKIARQIAALGTGRRSPRPVVGRVGAVHVPSGPRRVHADGAVERTLAGRLAAPEAREQPVHADGHLAGQP